ncbi:MAG TPA: hypothetical protein PK208_16345 [Fibrobacteria bacterium]|nr:hypothetical protein [Fibrobacteria bacterium]
MAFEKDALPGFVDDFLEEAVALDELLGAVHGEEERPVHLVRESFVDELVEIGSIEIDPFEAEVRKPRQPTHFRRRMKRVGHSFDPDHFGCPRQGCTH